jgi:hypothetical protein
MANTKVTSRVLANDAVLTANIADDQVTTAKIADDVALGGNPTTTTQTAGNNTTRIATTAFVTTAVANIVDSAPSALDTLNELAAALGDDANFSTTVTNSIATKLPLAGGTMTGTIAGFTSTGIDDNADATAITIDSSERVLIGTDSGDSFNADSMLRLQRAGDRVFMQFKTDADQNSGILFGDVDDDVECAIEYEPANKALTFSTGNNAEAIRIDNTGNIIHTPAAQGSAFDASDNTTWNALEIFQDRGVTNSGSGIAFRSQSGTSPAGIVSVVGNTTGGIESLAFITVASNVGAERMRISSDGLIGIGTTSPATKLEVDGGIRLSGLNGGDGLKFDMAGSTDYVIKESSTNDIFSFGGQIHHNISSGNVGIGTASPAFTNGSGLEIQRDGIATLRIEDTGSSGKPLEIFADDATGYHINGLGSGMPMIFSTVGTESMRITTTGNITAPNLNQTGSTSNRYPLYWVHTGTTGSIEPYTGSVRAMKTDIADMGSVDWIHSLTPRSFKFRDYTTDSEGNRTYLETTNDLPNTEYGLIAEEVDQVTGSDYILDKDADDNLNGVLYHNLVPILLKAVQELKTELDAAKARIETLES